MSWFIKAHCGPDFQRNSSRCPDEMEWLSSWFNYPSAQTLGQSWSHDCLQENTPEYLSADLILALWSIELWVIYFGVGAWMWGHLWPLWMGLNTLLWPPQFLLYCEGTRFTEKKHQISMQVAESKGLPQLKYHLLPRTKGFTTTMQCLKGTGTQTLRPKHTPHECPHLMRFYFVLQ